MPSFPHNQRQGWMIAILSPFGGDFTSGARWSISRPNQALFPARMQAKTAAVLIGSYVHRPNHSAHISRSSKHLKSSSENLCHSGYWVGWQRVKLEQAVSSGVLGDLNYYQRLVLPSNGKRKKLFSQNYRSRAVLLLPKYIRNLIGICWPFLNTRHNFRLRECSKIRARSLCGRGRDPKLMQTVGLLCTLFLIYQGHTLARCSSEAGGSKVLPCISFPG